MGQSGNFGSPFFLDQFPAWLKGTTFPFVFSDAAVRAAGTHTLMLTP
jgi:penicillin amidase